MITILTFILITVIVTTTAYFINTFVYAKSKDYSVIAAAVVEETLKTIGGLIAGSILYLHITFGVIEALTEIKIKERVSVLPAIFSILGHTAFGYITITVYRLTGNVFYGILSGIFSHIIYNSLVIGLVNSIKKP
ncbi:hypothetical protein PRVXH_000074 [Proteinivorax hydrogeniformans]|uniref:Uncharacterized protein n=1 Tax=Proteinivorax hydrogeniformans TaxID=1826727 RepID=A0AAU8HTC6_9FIRM